MEKLFFAMVICIGFMACQQPKTSDSTLSDSDAVAETTPIDTVHTSQNSLDWSGTYEGTIPCADCPGIKTTVVLNSDNTFSLTSEYMERNTKLEDKGSFMWHNNGSVVHLKGKETDLKLKVGEDMLFYLDQEGEEIIGPLEEDYILFKK